MKTTIEIADALLAKAKARARKEGGTLRALVEEGLRRVLEERKAAKPFKLRDGSFKGGTTPPDSEVWDPAYMRRMAYDVGRGGDAPLED